MSYSIYTSAYNLLKMGFDWQAVLDNWVRFLGAEGEIVIAVNTSEDATYDALTSYSMGLTYDGSKVTWQIIKTDFPYTDPLFDGHIKNAALKACTNRHCILLDFDEVIPLWSRQGWDETAAQLDLFGSPFEAALIPSIDLFHDPSHFMSLGAKWYLHLNLPHLGRGPVNFARRADGTIDIKRSDTTELINLETGDLSHYAQVMDPRYPESVRLKLLATGRIPLVYHLGWLDKQQRLKQSAFWAPVWNARNGGATEAVKTAEDFAAIEFMPHGLRHWSET